MKLVRKKIHLKNRESQGLSAVEITYPSEEQRVFKLCFSIFLIVGKRTPPVFTLGFQLDPVIFSVLVYLIFISFCVIE